ncbi:hypothetical protein RJG79_08565 [Mycoplasmatota bacterium WC44]
MENLYEMLNGPLEVAETIKERVVNSFKDNYEEIVNRAVKEYPILNAVQYSEVKLCKYLLTGLQWKIFSGTYLIESYGMFLDIIQESPLLEEVFHDAFTTVDESEILDILKSNITNIKTIDDKVHNTIDRELKVIASARIFNDTLFAFRNDSSYLQLTLTELELMIKYMEDVISDLASEYLMKA